MFRVLGFFTWTEEPAAPPLGTAATRGMMMAQTGYIRRRNYSRKVMLSDIQGLLGAFRGYTQRIFSIGLRRQEQS